MTVNEGYSDTGTVLKSTEAALITEDNGATISLLLPNMSMDEMPQSMVYLTICAMRSHDEEFVQEQFEWLTKQRQSAQ